VRPTPEFDAGHIPGARSLPVGELRQHLRSLPKDVEVVAYCRGPYCVYADDAVRFLRRRGYRAQRLEDGFPEWKQAGRPVAVGSGAGFDSFIAARQVGPTGQVVGIDMTPEMLTKSRRNAEELGFAHVSFRDGLAEAIPAEDGWADVVISNGVINLCADKRAAFSEILRVLRPGGRLQFADIANGQPVPEAAIRNIDLWTA